VTDCLAVEVGFGSGSIRTEDLGPMNTPQQERAYRAFSLWCMLFAFLMIIALVIQNLMK
jgi:hypothetical protein